MFNNLRAEIKRHNHTIADIGQILGISANAVSLKLNGKTEFTLKEIGTLAEKFNCSLDYLAVKNDTPAQPSV